MKLPAGRTRLRPVDLLAMSVRLAVVLAIAQDTAASQSRLPRTPEALVVREEWRRSIYGVNIGWEGLHVVDLDADGDFEIVATAGGSGFGQPRFWYVVSQDGEGFSQDWVSDEYPADITGLLVAQLDADAQAEVVVAAGNRVTVYDGASKEVEISWTATVQRIRALAVADLDGDSLPEAAFCDGAFGDALYVHELNSGMQEFEGLGLGCDDLAVGNVDDDAGVEIVLARNELPGLVLDGLTHLVEWSNPAGFGGTVRLGDLDSDGRAEIVAAGDQAGEPIAIYDGELQALAGTVPVPYPTVAGALSLLDADADGLLEIIYGNNFGRLRVFGGQTRTLKWEASNPLWGGYPTSGFTEIAVGNVDGDAGSELVWGSGNGSSSPDYLSVFDVVTLEHQWRSVDVTGPFRALSHGDVDGDGEPELLYASYESESGHDDGLWFVHDARTKALEYRSGPATGQSSHGFSRLAQANLDADPQHEVVVPAEVSFLGTFLICYDGATHAEQWRSPFIGVGLSVASMQVANIDGEPALELVASVQLESSAPRGLSIYVFDAATGSLEWQSPLLAPGSDMSYLRLGNVDADPNVEIVSAVAGDRLFAIDGLSHAISDLGNQDVSGLDLHDRNGDGVDEIVVGTRAGELRVVSTAGSVVETIGTYAGRVDGLRVQDVTGDGTSDYVFTVQDEVLIRDGATGVAQWNSGPLRQQGAEEVGRADSLLVADVDQDGRLEIVVNIGHIGLRVFEIAPRHDLTLAVSDGPDPILAGGPLTYDWTARNLAAADARDVTLDVALPVGATFVSSTPGPPTCTSAAGSLSCGLGGLASGTATTVSVVVNTQAAGSLQSTGVVAGRDPDPDGSNNTAMAATNVTATVEANLALAIDDGVGVVGPGSRLAYEIRLTNLGPWPIDGVTLSDSLPAALVNPAFAASLGVYDPGTGAWTGLGLSAGQAAILELRATVADAATGNLVNTAVVSPTAGVSDPVLGNNSASDTDLVVTGLVELTHGSSVLAALVGGADRSFRMRQQPRSSYEVVLDGVSGDLGNPATPVRLQRVGADLSVLAEGAPVGLGATRSLRWQNASTAALDGEAIRVRSGGCTTDCGADDVFRIRAYDTTYDLPRFNNGAGQASVVVVQNTTPAPVNGTVRFWSSSGASLATAPFASLPPHATLVLITPSIPGLAGQSGSITVTSDAPYGTLAGKVVAVEPATGLSFDTPMRARPR